MKILIAQAGTIADLLFTTPLIRGLKTELDADIDIICEDGNTTLLTENPYVSAILSFSDNLSSIKSPTYDVAFDLSGTSKTKKLCKKVADKVFTHDRQSLNTWMFVNFKMNKLKALNLADQYLELATPIGVKGDSLGLDFTIPEKDEVENEWLPVSHRHGYAAVLIDAAYTTRRLPTDRLIELCDRINKPIVLIGSATESAIGQKIEQFFQKGTEKEEQEIESLNKKTVIFNACGKFNFNQNASLIKESAWVFSYDNDLMHIAAAFKKKIFSIWGNTTALFGRYPYRTQFTIFENTKINCRPCTTKGHNACPKGHFKCMNDLTFDFYLPD